jgi:branched-chain amino acid aminotransferase
MRAGFRCAVIATDSGPLAGSAKKADVRAHVSAVRRFATDALPPAAKATGQYLNAYLAQAEAQRAGYDAAILLNDAGLVADGWANNVFIVADGVLVTPPTWTGALPGITRDTLLRLAADDGIPAVERPIVRSDLYLAEECFLTGTATGVSAVTSVDGRPVGDSSQGPVTKRLADLLAATVSGTSDAHPEWRELVS